MAAQEIAATFFAMILCALYERSRVAYKVQRYTDDTFIWYLRTIAFQVCRTLTAATVDLYLLRRAFASAAVYSTLIIRCTWIGSITTRITQFSSNCWNKLHLFHILFWVVWVLNRSDNRWWNSSNELRLYQNRITNASFSEQNWKVDLNRKWLKDFVLRNDQYVFIHYSW